MMSAFEEEDLSSRFLDRGSAAGESDSHEGDVRKRVIVFDALDEEQGGGDEAGLVNGSAMDDIDDDEVRCCRKEALPRGVARAGFHFRAGSRLRVFCFDSSAAEPRGAVVLLHGMLASHRAWEVVAKAIANLGYRCYTPDLLGFGESPWPRGLDAYDMEAHLGSLRRDVAAAISRDFGGDRVRVHLIGHSLGAVLAAEFASRSEDRSRGNRFDVASVATVAIPFFETNTDAVAFRKRSLCGCCSRRPRRPTTWRTAAVWLVLDFPILSFILCSIICQQRSFFIALARIVDGLRRTVRRRPLAVRVADSLNHSYYSVYGSFRHCIERHRLDPGSLRQSLPVLVAHGTRDDVVHCETSRAFHTKLSKFRRDHEDAAPARLVLLDDVKHSCHDAAEPLSRLLSNWISSVDSATAHAVSKPHKFSTIVSESSAWNSSGFAPQRPQAALMPHDDRTLV